jgi:penicillin-binding protein 1A
VKPATRGHQGGRLFEHEAVLRELYPDPEKKQWKPKLRRFLLDFDARFDNFIFQSGRWAREIWERFSMFMDRFHIGGWRRWVFVEPLSEAATMGAGGFVVLLALALPPSARPPTTTG